MQATEIQQLTRNSFKASLQNTATIQRQINLATRSFATSLCEIF